MLRLDTSQISDICEKFGKKIKKNDLSSLSFYYRKKELDLNKTFDEIININRLDRKVINIYVEENLKTDDDSFCSFFEQNKKAIIIVIAEFMVFLVIIIVILSTRKKK